ncbi:MAG: GDSL family lipase [Bacillota bacterium]|nr:GDSL family lipase [Bacillota bacterium]
MARVWAFVLVFLLLAELALPPLKAYYYNRHEAGFVFGERLPNKFILIHKEFPAALRYIERHRGDYDVNVVMLGDSIVWGAGLGVRGDQTISAYLEDELARRLPGRKVRVWNLGIPGSEPGDMYFALRRVERLQPDAVVADFNIIFYNPKSIADPVAFDWLYLDYGITPESIPEVRAVWDRPLGDRVADFLAMRWRLYREREWINALLFKEYPRQRFANGVKALVNRALNGAPASAPAPAPGGKRWYEQDWKAQLARVAFMYDPAPLDPAHNAACGFTAAALRHLKERGMPALVFKPDHNEAMLGKLASAPGFRANVAALDGLLRESGVPYLDMEGRVPSDFFADHVHLTAEGNRVVARELAAALVPQLAAQPGEGGAAREGVAAK